MSTYQGATGLRCFMFTLGAVYAPSHEAAQEVAERHGLVGKEARLAHAQLSDDMQVAYRQQAERRRASETA